MKKLPYSEPSFKSIIKNNQFYIDKTKEMYDLIQFSKYIFLSRPRRFGKSMLLSTLSAYYEGQKELFKGLWIEDKIEWESRGVIHIDFSNVYYHGTKEKFQKSFTNVLSYIAQKYDLSINSNANPDFLSSLIVELYNKTKKPVVILIDEYDKPITSYLTQIDKAIERRDWLREYYAVFKAHTDQIKQIVITGISKFAKTSIFSELNNVKDITMHPQFNNIVGFTSTDIEIGFAEYLEVFVKKTGWSKEHLLEEIALWYNGYSWDGKNKVYNPFSIVNLMGDMTFENYWFKSGTPKMLIDFITKKIELGEISQDAHIYENYSTDKDLLDNADVEHIDLHSLLFQTGYLTIKKLEQTFMPYGILNECVIGYPNLEVKKSMTSHILEAFSKIPRLNIQVDSNRLKLYLIQGNMEKFIELLRRFFALIPYQLRDNADEAYYHSLFQMLLTLIGVKIDTEKSTDKGRIDGVLELGSLIYIIEFKFARKGSMKYLHTLAFKQMKEKGYVEGFLGTNKTVKFLVIGFLEKTKNKKKHKSLEIDAVINDSPEYPKS